MTLRRSRSIGRYVLAIVWFSTALSTTGCGGRNGLRDYSGLSKDLSGQRGDVTAHTGISHGMSQEEVRAKLGPPNEIGTETKGEQEYLFWAYKPGRRGRKLGWNAWHTVRFTNGRVEDTMTANEPILSLASWRLEQRLADERAARIRADEAVKHNDLGSIYFRKGLYNEAVIEYERAVRLDPSNANAHYNLGYAYYSVGKHDLAVREFEQALELDPDDAEGHTNLCLVYFNVGRSEEAITECQKAMRLDSTDPVTHFNLGYIYWRMQRYVEAIAEYEKAQYLGLDTSDLHYSLGEIYAALNRWQLAVGHFQKALRLDPEHLPAKQGLERARENVEAR